MKELKPCDCGGKGIHLKYEGRNADYYHFIECIKCNYKTKFYQTEEQARDAWNKRELIMLGPKFGEPIQKTPEELGRDPQFRRGDPDAVLCNGSRSLQGWFPAHSRRCRSVRP